MSNIAALGFLFANGLHAVVPSSNHVFRAGTNAALEGARDSRLPAPEIARALAIINTCVYDAWSGYDDRAATHRQVRFSTQLFRLPPAAKITHQCNSFIPTYDDNTPQPPAKLISENAIDVIVHGFVGSDGKPTGLKVVDQSHPELAEEAIHTVASWTFHPAQCNYQPTSQQQDFIVHFQGWH